MYNSSGHLSNTQKHRMTIENLILDGPVQTLFSENKTIPKLYFQLGYKTFLYILFQDIVVMAQALEKVFLSKVAQMPSEVNNIF